MRKILNRWFLMGIFLKQLRVTEIIRAKNILWRDKPIMEGSVVIWDLENIPFHRLEDIKKIAKFTPQELYIVSKQHLGEKLLKKMHRENFKVLNAHKGISDSKIISIMKLYRDKENMILVSSDSDFAREANSYLKKGRLQWIVVDNVKRGVMMRVNLASKNLTLSSLAYKPSKQSAANRDYYKNTYKREAENKHPKRVHKPAKRGKILIKKRPPNIQKKDSQIRIYFEYYKGKMRRVIKRVKKLYKKAIYHFKELSPKEESKITKRVEVNNPVEGKRDIYRRNFRGKRVRAGTLQFRKDIESILYLYKNLSKKYKMPQFEKQILFYEFEEIDTYIHFNFKEQEYYLNDFPRKSYDDVI